MNVQVVCGRATEVDATLVLPNSSCTAPGGRHTWTKKSPPAQIAATVEDLEELMRDFKQEIAGIKLGTLGSIIAVTTNAEVVQHLRSYGELEYNPGFDHTLWRKGLSSQNHEGQKHEKTISLPLISIPEDRVENVSFRTRKPDFVGYARGRGGPNAITIFGDAKPYPGPAGFPFTEQQIGQVVDMAFEFLRHVQPWRLFVIVLLTDTRRWQFFKITRNKSKICGFDTIESSVHIDAAGLAIYSALLCASHSDLGYSDRSIDGVDAMQNSSGLERMFPRGMERQFETERQNLTRLRELPSWREYVPSIVSDALVSKSADSVLAMTPLGVAVKPCNDGHTVYGEHIVQLIGIVEEVHTICGLAHRDIKPHNIFFKSIDGGRYDLFLNDWGSAANIGVESVFEGTLGFYDIPDDSERHVPTAEADLVAVVRSAYLRLFNEMPPTSSDDIAAFWRARLKTQLWLDALEACYRRDYKALAAELLKIK
eukprot:gene27601-36403_t